MSVTLKTEDNHKINLEYVSPEEKENRSTVYVDGIFDKTTESVLYLLMKYGVSMEFYHELSMIFKQNIPRSYQVAIAIVIASIASYSSYT